MFYTQDIPPKKAAILKALLYAGWAPDQKASNAADQFLVLTKDGYRFEIKEFFSFCFLKKSGRLWEKIFCCPYSRFSFDTRNYYIIHINSSKFVQYSVNLLHPEQNSKTGDAELEDALKKCQAFLMKYASTNGVFPTKSTFKHWIASNLRSNFKTVKFIYQQGQDTHWVATAAGVKGTGRPGTRISPVFNGVKRATLRKTEKETQTT